MTALCRYRDVLGRPGRGLHAPRLFGKRATDSTPATGLALVDMLGAAALTAVVTRAAFGRSPAWKYAVVFVFIILVTVAIHIAFCVDTRLVTILRGGGASAAAAMKNQQQWSAQQ